MKKEPTLQQLIKPFMEQHGWQVDIENPRWWIRSGDLKMIFMKGAIYNGVDSLILDGNVELFAADPDFLKKLEAIL